MKYLYSFLVAFAVMSIIVLILNLFNINNAQFFVGWLSCMGYYITMDYFEKNERN